MTEREPSNSTQHFDATFIREHPEIARDSLVAYWSGKMDRVRFQISEFVLFDETENDTRGFMDIAYEAIKGDIIWRSQEDPAGYFTYNPADVWGPYNVVSKIRKTLLAKSPEDKFHNQVHILFSDYVEMARNKALFEVCSDDELGFLYEIRGIF